MSESRAKTLYDRLVSLSLRVREIRILSLVDHDGLTMVTTSAAPELEEAMGAFGGAMATLLHRGQRDFELGPLYHAHVVGRDRQLFVTPVTGGANLVAVVDAHATPATIAFHLMALAKEIQLEVADLLRGLHPKPTR